ncbi:TPA: adenosine monophosphate-protein transferase [Candidatus Geothermarchaeota archaeon]|nr:adenosine monophosphate-protein transferase [Candidatus Geothermarchaeota archaeon]HIQ12816.1 adenosine monophosphate-protein transferase [Thermoprotei archaeon]
MVDIKVVDVKPPKDVNVIAGMSHFIKTVEDLYEALSTSSLEIKFGIAFCEASGHVLIRYDGNDDELVEFAVETARKVAAGHFFIVAIKNAFPINVLDKIRKVDEIVNIMVATANPIQFIVAETDQGRAVLGVVDGFKSRGVEEDRHKKERYDFLRKIGYKR